MDHLGARPARPVVWLPVVEELGTSTAVYAGILGRSRWPGGAGRGAVLVTPPLHGQGGAMRLAPRSVGPAVRAFGGGMLSTAWRSSDDIGGATVLLR